MSHRFTQRIPVPAVEKWNKATGNMETVREAHEAFAVLTVDVNAIIGQLTYRAARSKKRMATAMHGKIKLTLD